MKQVIGSRRLVRWGIGAAVLLLAHGLGAPGTAFAGCSHQVTSQADRRLDIHRLDDLVTGDSNPTPTGQPCRCSGPGCSSDTPRPASTASPSSDGPDLRATLGSVLVPMVTSPPRLLPDQPAARPVGHKPSIFHPPPA